MSNAADHEVIKGKTKNYQCPFCNKKLVGKLIDHLLTRHKHEPAVIEIKSLRSRQTNKREVFYFESVEAPKTYCGPS